GLPGHEELAMGAVASGGVRVLTRGVVEALHVPQDVIEQVAAAEMAALSRGEGDLRGEQAAPDVRGKTVILVDDGLATGSTMLAAAAALRQEQPARLVVGVPVAALETCDAVSGEVDVIVCVVMLEPYYAVGVWYEDFSLTAGEVVGVLVGRSAFALRRSAACGVHVAS